MKSEEAQAMNRLLKKLTALRATLGDDERALLDGFVVTPKPIEVSAHMLEGAPVPAPTPKPIEVSAHVLEGAPVPAPHPRYIVVFDAVKDIYRIA